MEPEKTSLHGPTIKCQYSQNDVYACVNDLIKLWYSDVWYVMSRHHAYHQNKSRPEYGRPVIFYVAIQYSIK